MSDLSKWHDEMMERHERKARRETIFSTLWAFGVVLACMAVAILFVVVMAHLAPKP